MKHCRRDQVSKWRNATASTPHFTPHNPQTEKYGTCLIAVELLSEAKRSEAKGSDLPLISADYNRGPPAAFPCYPVMLQNPQEPAEQRERH